MLKKLTGSENSVKNTGAPQERLMESSPTGCYTPNDLDTNRPRPVYCNQKIVKHISDVGCKDHVNDDKVPPNTRSDYVATLFLDAMQLLKARAWASRRWRGQPSMSWLPGS